MKRWQLLLPLLLSSTSAWALKPDKHSDMAEDACMAQRLPTQFCRRVGKAAYETDWREWDDRAAHAQTLANEPHCDAADNSTRRIADLAGEMLKEARSGHHEAAAIALGRALHTIQDECAHKGMTFEEHAYYSLEQTCSSDDVSPDIQPAALACARERSQRVMALAANALAGTSWAGVDEICKGYFVGNERNQRDACDNKVLPGRSQACEFLTEAYAWDGADSTWNSTVVGAAFVSAFASGLLGAQPPSLCRDPAALAPRLPHATVSPVQVDVCTVIDVVCLGKVDEDDDAQVSPYGEDHAGGCAAGGSPGLVLLALACVLPRRRRQK